MSLLETSPAGLDRRVETCQGAVAIDGIDMHRLAFELFDLSPLFGQPALRGRNRLMPGTPGTIAYAPRVTETRFSLPLLVCGHWNLNDDWVAPDDIWEELATNVDWLNANVLLPTGVGSGTRTAVWTKPGGGTVTSEVQVLQSQPPVNLGHAVLITTLEILAPDGDLHL